MGIDLPLIWYIIIVFSIMMYVVLDGFDLGIGLLFPFMGRSEDRDVMMNTVAPVWDGNETWLVLGGAGLLGAFPLAYSVILDAMSLPLTVMLFGLIFRGVAFEFRFKADHGHRPFWDKSFIAGSLIATFAQGVVLGSFLNGFHVEGRTWVGGAMDWFNPFSLFCGLGLVVAYALLGCSWLIVKTSGRLQQNMRELCRPLLILLLVVIAIVSIWTPLAHHAIAERWFSLPNFFFFLPVPILVLVLAWGLWRTAWRDSAHHLPFILTLALVFMGFSGLGISVWPNIIPPDISFTQAASPPQSQGFLLVGTLFIIPIILMYNCWSYYVFRGKVSPEDGYH
ncbi:cytochrome d ubiquinol oxidase subunit II [Gallaecimonas pentaromativorans]|uniref:Cytochrome bd-I ubiquinol oxidase subunit 2 apoprotein n=1 Tax=Gallaecimonas pentaromativorans TaxID=584787 RepID=A0A3N1P4R5_9GAMM|nr:cytochrome d ubiquinol oxidase subunit II [Gallaecimonas pentaromativorans]MED5525113.1 cytochrome d ubiquinol oxidase subunit II [Pseudomonadota bacterium]ROQ22648.1 cytochrome bd-I ubiquinol oxidase subunit 2 apoprotein [Gallaecimonas pentaromativorans]